MNIYDDKKFFEEYEKMDRSRLGLAGAGSGISWSLLIPELRGKTVLDLGCGYGWHCRYAAEHGAERVLGIDQSSRMIEKAESFSGDGRISYEIKDLADFAYPPETYDFVISNLVLHYVEELTEVYRRVYRTLKPGGTFLFNIEHPTFTAGVNQSWVCDDEGHPLYWPVDDYYYPGERETLFWEKK